MLALGLSVCALLAAPWMFSLPTALDSSVLPSELLDRHGRTVAVHNAGAGVVPWGKWLPLATKGAEDHRFAVHPGVDPIGVLRALRADLSAGRIVQGGSTLDQQLARRLVPRSGGFSGKFAEAVRALQLRARLGGDAVLDEYLARTWYGNGSVGAGVAAFTYFDRPAAALSLAQAATLAAIPRRPADLDPLHNPEWVRRARDSVLGQLVDLRWISQSEHDDAVAEPMALISGKNVDLAPHFVRRVLRDHEQAHTGLDLDLQAAAESAVQRHLPGLAGRNVTNAAVLVVHNATREVRAYVGSAGWDGPSGQVDMVSAPRSPGSALKPFLYALALERGHTLADIVADTPQAWTTTHGAWSPRNYAEGSAGPVQLRVALATSLNVPAVRLANEIGVADLHRTLGDLGLTTLTDRPDHYGLGLVIGDGEVRLDELVAAYATFASQGRYRPLKFRTDDHAPPRQIFTAEASFLILDALDDPNARTAAFGYDSALEPAWPMAAKTGTSTAFRDNWAIGVTPQFTIGVWVGNADGSPMVEVSGITGAGPILRDVADAAMAGVAPREFVVPPTLARTAVCPLSGGIAGQYCPDQRAEWLLRSASHPPCRWHSADGAHLPAEFAAWNGADSETFTPGATKLTIAYPANNSTFWISGDQPTEDQAIWLRLSGGPGGPSNATWMVDGTVLATVPPPWRARWEPTPGNHTLVVEVGGVASDPALVHIGGNTLAEAPLGE